jgi:hypothetical protein
MHLQRKKVKTKKILTFCYWNYLDQKWAEMLDALPENDVRYAVIDIFYDTNEGSRAEIYFIAW